MLWLTLLLLSHIYTSKSLSITHNIQSSNHGVQSNFNQAIINVSNIRTLPEEVLKTNQDTSETINQFSEINNKENKELRLQVKADVGHQNSENSVKLNQNNNQQRIRPNEHEAPNRGQVTDGRRHDTLDTYPVNYNSDNNNHQSVIRETGQNSNSNSYPVNTNSDNYQSVMSETDQNANSNTNPVNANSDNYQSVISEAGHNTNSDKNKNVVSDMQTSVTLPDLDDRAGFDGDKCPNGSARVGMKCVKTE